MELYIDDTPRELPDWSEEECDKILEEARERVRKFVEENEID